MPNGAVMGVVIFLTSFLDEIMNVNSWHQFVCKATVHFFPTTKHLLQQSAGILMCYSKISFMPSSDLYNCLFACPQHLMPYTIELPAAELIAIKGFKYGRSEHLC